MNVYGYIAGDDVYIVSCCVHLNLLYEIVNVLLAVAVHPLDQYCVDIVPVADADIEIVPSVLSVAVIGMLKLNLTFVPLLKSV